MEKMIGHIFGTLDRHERMLRMLRKANRKTDERINWVCTGGIFAFACIYLQQKQIDKLRRRLDQKNDEGMG